MRRDHEKSVETVPVVVRSGEMERRDMLTEKDSVDVWVRDCERICVYEFVISLDGVLEMELERVTVMVRLTDSVGDCVGVRVFGAVLVAVSSGDADAWDRLGVRGEPVTEVVCDCEGEKVSSSVTEPVEESDFVLSSVAVDELVTTLDGVFANDGDFDRVGVLDLDSDCCQDAVALDVVSLLSECVMFAEMLRIDKDCVCDADCSLL